MLRTFETIVGCGGGNEAVGSIGEVVCINERHIKFESLIYKNMNVHDKQINSAKKDQQLIFVVLLVFR